MLKAFAPDQYALLDFGGGRKLERFGGLIVDRPSPAAGHVRPARPELWRKVHARFDVETGWSWTAGDPGSWRIEVPLESPLTLALRETDSGQVGVFPEQFQNWVKLRETLVAREAPARVLNLFAYTGASTLVAAAAGAEVTHVNAARNVVPWARHNAEISGLGDATVRWIVDDAAAFVRRELRRGRAYDGVLLDPPTYGHGPKHRQTWRLTDDLSGLVADCLRLIAGEGAGFLALSCHTTGVAASDLAAMLDGHGRVTADTMWLATDDGRRLASGVVTWLNA